MDNDISKIVSLIMENPQLINEIKALAEKNESRETPQTPKQETAETSSLPTYQDSEITSRRRQLLGALKPYLSSERAKAIDSMLTIGDIIDIARKK